MPDQVEDIFTVKVNKSLIEIEQFFINSGLRSNLRRIRSLGDGLSEVTFSKRQVLTEMKNRSFEIHSVTLKKKVYKIEIPEVAEKVDPKPEESPKLPPEKLFEFPRPYLNKELPIRVTAVIDPYNILAYVKTKESEAFMDQLDKTCQELPVKYKDVNLTHIICIKLGNIKPAGGTSSWTKCAKDKFTQKVTKFADLRAKLTSKDEHGVYLGKVFIRLSYIEDPLTCDEKIIKQDAAQYLIKKGVALMSS